MRDDNFLDRMKFVLGDRRKHPWGQALGIRGTRITEMFRGRIPTADALAIIHWAEGVSTDWLLTGDGAPFCVRHLTDQEGVALLREQDGNRQYHYHLLVTEPLRIPALALVRPGESQPIDPDSVARYPATILVAQVGRAMMRELAGVDQLYLTSLEAQVMEQLRAGNLGPYQLRQVFLPHGRRAEAADLRRITEFLDRSDLPGLPPEEAALLRAYRAQPEHKQAACRTLLDVEP